MYASSLRRAALAWLTAGLAIASAVGDNRVKFNRPSWTDVTSGDGPVPAVARDAFEPSLNTLQKRANIQWVDMNQVKATRDPNIELWTAGLVTCNGIAITMEPRTADGPSKVLAHINSELGSDTWRAAIRKIENYYLQATEKGRLRTKKPKNVRITMSIGKMRNYAHGRTQPGLEFGMTWTYAQRWQSCLDDVLDRLGRLTDAEIDIVERDIVDTPDLRGGQGMMGIQGSGDVVVEPSTGYPDLSEVELDEHQMPE